jgi:hypothetical protein
VAEKCVTYVIFLLFSGLLTVVCHNAVIAVLPAESHHLLPVVLYAGDDGAVERLECEPQHGLYRTRWHPPRLRRRRRALMHVLKNLPDVVLNLELLRTPFGKPVTR